MKTLIISATFLLSTILVSAQSYSKADLFDILDKDNQKNLIANLKEKGFKYGGSADGLKIYQKAVTAFENETLSFGKQSGRFIIQYKPQNEIYTTMKQEIIKDNFIFQYKKKKVEYYGHETYGVGFFDKGGIIVFFKAPN